MADRARILVVDDDSENGEFLKDQLSGDGCQAVWFKDPRAALRATRRNRFQLAILDLKMPHIDGVELSRRLREKDPDIGLIILTGYPTIESVLATMKSGAYDYVKKPYSIDDLRKTIKRLLEDKGIFLEDGVSVKKHIGHRVREYRNQRRMTVASLASQTQLSKSLISQIENAKNSASLDSLAKIARSLKVRIADLVQDL